MILSIRMRMSRHQAGSHTCIRQQGFSLAALVNATIATYGSSPLVTTALRDEDPVHHGLDEGLHRALPNDKSSDS